MRLRSAPEGESPWSDRRPIGVAAGFIAAIAREAGATVVTRDPDDFDGVGLELVDPWVV